MFQIDSQVFTEQPFITRYESIILDTIKKIEWSKLHGIHRSLITMATQKRMMKVTKGTVRAAGQAVEQGNLTDGGNLLRG